MFKFLHEGLRHNTDLRAMLGKSRQIEDFQAVLDEMKSRRVALSKDLKFGWYFRHRNFKKSKIPVKKTLPKRIRIVKVSPP
jgi:hypothetical protein